MGDRRDVYGAVVLRKEIMFYRYLYGVQEVRRWRPAMEGNFCNLQIHYQEVEAASPKLDPGEPLSWW